ncbi:D-alanine--D-alanine ligase family protein [Ekhidna sp.]
MKNLVILCGGQSPEHEISLRSTRNVLNALDSTKYNVILVGINQRGEWRLIERADIAGNEILDQGYLLSISPGSKEPFNQNGKSIGMVDVIFPILHGPNGEDGTIQGLFRLLNIPFVGPDVLGSSASMDKDVTKRLLRDSGIMVADWILIQKGEEVPSYDEIKDALGGVVFVKPANMGSSVGVSRVSNNEEWLSAVDDAFKYDRKVLVERQIEGKELECAVLGNGSPKATIVGEVLSGNFYSYEEKYDSSSVAEVRIPAQIDERYLEGLKIKAIEAYKSLDCEVMARVDMFLTTEGDIYVNEINTIPGFTSISMYPKLWEYEGLQYSELLDQLINLSIERHNS